jgi:hypothetical protein
MYIMYPVKTVRPHACTCIFRRSHEVARVVMHQTREAWIISSERQREVRCMDVTRS